MDLTARERDAVIPSGGSWDVQKSSSVVPLGVLSVSAINIISVHDAKNGTVRTKSMCPLMVTGLTESMNRNFRSAHSGDKIL